MWKTAQIEYRRIDPDLHADLAFDHYREACIASYGSTSHGSNHESYVKWLRSRVEEFPDGHVLAMRDDACIGQLELQAPYGLPDGYINLYWVASGVRRRGVGMQLHAYVERYFRSWEVRRIELHVAPGNEAAMGFYRTMGYRILRREGMMYRMCFDL